MIDSTAIAPADAISASQDAHRARLIASQDARRAEYRAMLRTANGQGIINIVRDTDDDEMVMPIED